MMMLAPSTIPSILMTSSATVTSSSSSTCSSSQYLYPDYNSTCLTSSAFDTTQSPLALLAQTCNSIGQDVVISSRKSSSTLVSSCLDQEEGDNVMNGAIRSREEPKDLSSPPTICGGQQRTHATTASKILVAPVGSGGHKQSNLSHVTNKSSTLSSSSSARIRRHSDELESGKSNRRSRSDRVPVGTSSPAKGCGGEVRNKGVSDYRYREYEEDSRISDSPPSLCDRKSSESKSSSVVNRHPPQLTMSHPSFTQHQTSHHRTARMSTSVDSSSEVSATGDNVYFLPPGLIYPSSMPPLALANYPLLPSMNIGYHPYASHHSLVQTPDQTAAFSRYCVNQRYAAALVALSSPELSSFGGGALAQHLSTLADKSESGAGSLMCRDPYCTFCQILAKAQLDEVLPRVSSRSCRGNGDNSSGPCSLLECSQCSADDRLGKEESSSSPNHQNNNHHNKNNNERLSAFIHGPINHHPHSPLQDANNPIGLPYVCSWLMIGRGEGGGDYCAKSFSSADELLDHLRLHATSSSSADNSALLQYGSSAASYPPLLGLGAAHYARLAAASGYYAQLASAASVQAQNNYALQQLYAAQGLTENIGNCGVGNQLSASLLSASRYHPYKSPLHSFLPAVNSSSISNSSPNKQSPPPAFPSGPTSLQTNGPLSSYYSSLYGSLYGPRIGVSP